MFNVRTPLEEPTVSREASVPDIENDKVSPSPSVAVKVPTFVTFSEMVNESVEVNTGASCISTTLTVTFFEAAKTPSEAAITIE